MDCQHEWVEVPADGPAEEGAVCKNCGAWATSEQDLPCIQGQTGVVPLTV